MNENIDLTKILKNCPKGWELYSSFFGEVEFEEINCNNEKYPIRVRACNGLRHAEFTKEGFYFANKGECTLFPSREQRNWSKFTALWYKKERFDPKTLCPFDKVLARDTHDSEWGCDFFCSIDIIKDYKYNCLTSYYKYCIPYNDETRHLVGKTDEAPEYYRYWET